jgi:hypothetical protein
VNLKELTLRAAVLKVLADEVDGRLAAAKEAARAAFRETGTSQAVPELADGTKVATASLAGDGGKSASVTNDAALLAWVAEHHPEEIVSAIRDNYKKKLLDAAKEAGRGVDPATGEVVPGITVGPSTPYVSLRFRPGGRDAVIAAWRAGGLRDIELVAPAGLEGSEGTEAA